MFYIVSYFRRCWGWAAIKRNKHIINMKCLNDVSERIQFRVAATVYRCLHNMAPRYLSDMCKPITSLSRRQSLRSDTTSDLVIPRVRRATYGCRAFSVSGPVCWNDLPDYLKSPDLSFDRFKRQLKTFLFCAY